MTAAATFIDVKRAYGTGRLFVKHDAWYGSWRIGESRVTRKLGPVKAGRRDGLTKTQAEHTLREQMLAASVRAPKHASTATVSQLGAALVARLEQQHRKPSHIETVRYHISRHINPAVGDESVDLVTVGDLQRLVDHMLQRGSAPKTVRNVVGTTHSLFAMAVEVGQIDRNPCDRIRQPQLRPGGEIRFLTGAELDRVLAAAPPATAAQAERDWWPVLRMLVLTAAMTGMRLGELRALRWSDLDFGAMKVRVRQSFVRGEYGSPKSRRSVRAIPLAGRLVSELDEHHKRTIWNQDPDLVLAHPHTGRPLDRVRLLQHFKAALQRANVRPVRIHDLRHTFATTVAASGQVSLRTLQEWMGHLDARTTQIYADYMPGEREAALLDEAFAPRTPNRLQIAATQEPKGAVEPR